MSLIVFFSGFFQFLHYIPVIHVKETLKKLSKKLKSGQVQNQNFYLFELHLINIFLGNEVNLNLTPKLRYKEFGVKICVQRLFKT